jgi:seryl-tRNA synthetase
MSCEYEAVFELSKTLKKEAIKEVKELVEKVKNKTSNPSKFKYKIKLIKKYIKIKVECEENTATNFLVQVNKKLSESLGKKYKVGVRCFEAKNYKISFDVEKKPVKKFKVPYVDKLEIKNKKAAINYKKVSKLFIKNNKVERTINLINELINKQYYEGKGEYHEVLYESPKKKPVWEKNPTEEMIKKGWLIQGPTKGKWFYQPIITAVFKAIEKIVMEELIKPLGFHEVICSNIIPFEEVWKKTGHLEGMPMEIYYVAEPKTRKVKDWDDFVNKLKIDKEVPFDEYIKMIQWKPLRGLTYAQCPIIYWSMKGRTINGEDLPVKLFERTQNSYRYEAGGRHGIERVDEFKRVEILYIGAPEQVIELKDKIMKIYKNIFDNILDLEWRTAWVTPFYMQHAGDDFKQDYGQKVKGTVDYEAWLPFRGSRKSEWLEFQNISIVGDKYSKAFNIKTQKGELWSGCSGVGIQRWTVSFLAQKGLDPKNWPKEFKKYLPELPEQTRFL